MGGRRGLRLGRRGGNGRYEEKRRGRAEYLGVRWEVLGEVVGYYTFV